jgi:uncharacterized membrane protein YeaQ/YmgE (transglycosylase-associated protein family)
MKFSIQFLLFFFLAIAAQAESRAISVVNAAMRGDASKTSKVQENALAKGRKSGIFAKLAQKMLRKRLVKMAKTLEISGSASGDGRGLAISGIILGILTIASWLISPYLGIIFTIPLGVVGALLSIFGLLKANRFYDSKTSRALSIAGIALNGLLLILFLGLLAWASS